MIDEKDYLDHLIEMQIENDPAFAEAWLPHALILDLSRERVRLGLTQQDVADRLGVQRSTVARMEHNPEGVSLSRIARYAHAIGATLKVVPGEAPLEASEAKKRSRPLVARAKRKAA